MEKFTLLATNFTLPPGLTGWTNFTSVRVKKTTNIRYVKKRLVYREKIASIEVIHLCSADPQPTTIPNTPATNFLITFSCRIFFSLFFLCVLFF